MNAKPFFYPASWLTTSILLAMGSAHAIGLGEIRIHSALGEPLQASIALLGGKNLSADCITLQAPHDYGLPLPPGLKFEIKEVAGKPSRLWLSTRQAMHEPALGVTVVLKCEGELQREYAILLDINPLVTREDTEPTLAQASTGNIQPAPIRMAAPRNAGLMNKEPRPQTPPDASPNKSTISSKPRKLVPANAEPRPVLTLSGVRLLRVDPELGMPLKLDLSLPDPSRIPEKPLTEIERQDDNAALTHKLAHLEQQLATLQKRNEELSRRAQLQTTHSTPTENLFSAIPQWLYLLAGGLLLSGGIAWFFYQRKTKRLYEEVDYLFSTPETQEIAAKSDALAILDAHALKPTPISTPEVEQQTSPFEIVEPHEKTASFVEDQLTKDDLSMGIQLLQESIEKNPHASPAPWLTLLDFLHNLGDAERYNQVRNNFSKVFNISAPEFSLHDTNPRGARQNKAGLESYPHVLSELLRLWPSGETTNYLETLLHDTRNGTRSGFDLQSFEEILLLIDILRFSGTSAATFHLDLSDLRDLRS